MEGNIDETGKYNTLVTLCLGQASHEANMNCLMSLNSFTSFHQIHEYVCNNTCIFLLLGEGKHKIKKKAEQLACQLAINALQSF